MRLMIDNTIYRDRLTATLGLAFAILAMLLAAICFYGTVSYSPAENASTAFATRPRRHAANGSRFRHG